MTAPAGEAYFERLSATRFCPTPHVGGGWRPEEAHIAPVLGLLAHLVEVDRDARGRSDLVLARLTWDILGVLPIEPVDTLVQVLRPGRTVELVEARLSHGGRDAVVLRAWLLQPGDSAAHAGTTLPTIPGPEQTPPVDATQMWPGGFIASTEVRRHEIETGHARSWVRSPVVLLADEPVSPLASATRLIDIANGMAVRADPRKVTFPNLDLTLHVFRPPTGEWIGLDTRVSFGPGGVGLTSSVLHDPDGPFGTVNQALTVRPR